MKLNLFIIQFILGLPRFSFSTYFRVSSFFFENTVNWDKHTFIKTHFKSGYFFWYLFKFTGFNAGLGTFDWQLQSPLDLVGQPTPTRDHTVNLPSGLEILANKHKHELCKILMSFCTLFTTSKQLRHVLKKSK